MRYEGWGFGIHVAVAYVGGEEGGQTGSLVISGRCTTLLAGRRFMKGSSVFGVNAVPSLFSTAPSVCSSCDHDDVPKSQSINCVSYIPRLSQGNCMLSHRAQSSKMKYTEASPYTLRVATFSHQIRPAPRCFKPQIPHSAPPQLAN